MATSTLVPAARLLWVTGLVVVPAATVAGAVPSMAALASLAILVVVLLAAADAVLGWSRLAAVTVAAPPVIHGAVGREVELAASVSGLVTATLAGLSLPDVVRCEFPVVPVTAPSDTARWKLLVLKRGRHRFDSLYLEASTPLGLWLRRRALPLGTEVHIYPDLRRERAGLAAVFLNRGGPGMHARRQLGKGREFERLRDYGPGDDLGDIHWKTTARRGFPVTKTFQLERTREVYAVLDHSRLSARPLRTVAVGEADPAGRTSVTPAGGAELVTTQLDRALECALTLGLAAERQHDHFGLVTFADQVTRFVRSGAGRSHFGACRSALISLEPRLVAPNFEELFVFLSRTLPRRSLIVILTDLSDPLQFEAFARSVRLISRHHLVMVSMIRPGHAAPMFTHTTTASSEDVYRDLAGHFLWHDLQEVAAVLSRQGVRFSLPDSSALAADLVSRYMEVKNRQVL